MRAMYLRKSYAFKFSWYPIILEEDVHQHDGLHNGFRNGSRCICHAKNSMYSVEDIYVKLSRHWNKEIRRFAVGVYLVILTYALFNYKSDCIVSHPQALLQTTGQPDVCHVSLTSLGNTLVNTEKEYSDYELEEIHSGVDWGGAWSPRDCKARQQVAVIIPYRNRKKHLQSLLMRLHHILRRQKLSYQIFVIEQVQPEDFNRGMLRNIGFLESENYGPFDCYIFHDVDLIPENDRNLYMCDEGMRQLSSAIDEWRYHIIFYNNAGGVISISRSSFLKVNGYPNCYWVWGGEDDELWLRGKDHGLLLTRPPENIGKYKAIQHKKAEGSYLYMYILSKWRQRMFYDGVNSLKGKYTVLQRRQLRLYTYITTDISSIRDAMRDYLTPWLWWADPSVIAWLIDHYYP